ncbi:MAG: hypothetical protein P9X24_09110 [Candidatus Hatepunaea meridiana]|nr:hypothetical protein [Candidatus Hatepunaea meridiana]
MPNNSLHIWSAVVLILLLIFTPFTSQALTGESLQTNQTELRQELSPDTTITKTVEIVKRVTELYEAGNITEAENFGMKALEDPEGLSRLDRSNLYKVLAFCAIANEDDEGSIRRFVEALNLNPLITPNQITWSPKIRRVFALARDVYETQQRKDKLSRRMQIADICRISSRKSLYFPGSGQYYKEHKVKGLIIGAIFWAAAGTHTYSQISIPSTRNHYLKSNNRVEAIDRWKDYQDVYQVAYVSGAIAISAYAYAFFDALWADPAEEKLKQKQ